MPTTSHLVVTGAGGSLGRRVLALAAADAAVARLTASDLRATTVGGVAVRALDLVAGDLSGLVEDADVLVHLAFRPGERAAGENVEGTRRLLEAAGVAGVRQVVLLSSATVYGAWPENPVPLTEAAVVRPNPGASYALQKAEIERLGAAWSAEHPDATLTVLRPAVSVAGDDWSWLARALGLVPGLRTVADPPFQLLHLDDLAAAVDHVRRAGLCGVFNVAPDGWLSGSEALALAGEPPRVRLPEWAVHRLTSFAWDWRLGRRPPGLVPYTLHPWVVGNDRLRATGWAPAHANEESLVDATPGTPWSRVSPTRRQELALGAALTTTAAAAGGALTALRRARRARSGPG